MEGVVDRFVLKHQLLKKHSTVVVGVSGGPDSMALLHYLLQKRKHWNVRLVVAHLNHMFRGEQSETDYVYVENYAHEHGLSFEGAHIDVEAYKQRHSLTMQVAARECRYQFFTTVMNKYAADFLALGHHGDDQIETMMMRQVRGAIGFAHAGIPVKRPFAGGMIIRPLLCIEKAELVHYLNQVGIKPRIDPSNEQDDYVRNRVRHVILPFFKSENPKVHERFQQQSELILEDEELLMSMAEQQFQNVVKRKENNDFAVNRTDFNSLQMPLQRRVIQLLLECLYNLKRTDVQNIHIEQIIALFHNENPSGMLHLPANLHVIRSYDQIHFTFDVEQELAHYFYRVHVPFELNLPHGVVIGDTSDEKPKAMQHNVFVGDAEEIRLPLTIRTREAGDRLYPLGMDGSKKLKALFIDEKIDKRKRDIIPVVEDAEGNILWVAGVRRAKFALVTEKTSQFLYIAYRESDGF